MNLSPLIIEFYYFKKIHFDLKEGFDSRSEVMPTTQPRMKVLANVTEAEAGKWRADLSIDGTDSDEEFPYTFAAELVGFFQVAESYPAEMAANLARVNGPAVLYSAARETLAIVTGRSPYPQVLLPAVSFVHLVSDAEAEPAKAKRAPRKPRKIVK